MGQKSKYTLKNLLNQDAKILKNTLKLKNYMISNVKLRLASLNLPADELKSNKKVGVGEEKKKIEFQNEEISYFSLYRFCERNDKVLGLIGAISSFFAGILLNFLLIDYCEITATIVEAGRDEANNETEINKICNINDDAPEDYFEKLSRLAINTLRSGLIFIVLINVSIFSFSKVSENVIQRLRSNYFKALLRQNIGWYDKIEEKSFVSRMSEDVLKIQEATGEKVGLLIFYMSQSFFSALSAFWHGWKLALLILSFTPIYAIVGNLETKIQYKLTEIEQSFYAKAGESAEEAINNIKTVKAFNGEEEEVKWYENGLKKAVAVGKRRGLISGFCAGFMSFFNYALYSLALWNGAKLIIDEPQNYSSSNILIVLNCIYVSTIYIAQCVSDFEILAIGRGVAKAFYQVIDRVPPIDVYSSAGKIPSGRIRGKIEFKNIKFSYPSRPGLEILNNFSLTVENGKTVAIVGHSGCGKSTLIQLLQRFYDPLQGEILVDGKNIKEYNLEWLRSQIGVVSQEPVLFNTSIYENIRFGRMNASEKEVIEAARQANAHPFISKLPMGYQTLVGDRGTQLSGGQKQRIAIARAILRDCPILLLDEATSALDNQSESIVQKAFNREQNMRTVIIVAHRLSTILQADYIFAINNGKVEEVGTHTELLARNRLYHSLIQMQIKAHENGEGLSLNLPKNHTSNQKIEFGKGKKKFNYTNNASLEISPNEKDVISHGSLFRVLSINKNEWGLIFLGTLVAILSGPVLLYYNFIFAESQVALSNPQTMLEVTNYALHIILIGIILGGLNLVQSYAFTLSGEALTLRLRKLTFGAILRQEAGWFDSPKQSSGSLSTRLSVDGGAVSGMTGSRIGIFVQAGSTLIFASILSLYISPKLGVVALIFSPTLLFASYFEWKLSRRDEEGEREKIEEAGMIVSEALSSIRTVMSLGAENHFALLHDEKLKNSNGHNLRRSLVRGAILGLAQSMNYFAYATVLWYGGWLIKYEGEKNENVLKESLLYGSMTIGQAISYAPNYNKAKLSAARIFKLLDRRPRIDNSLETGLIIGKRQLQKFGDEWWDLYPRRPMTKVLRGLSLEVKKGHKIGLVGHSGCGKSSCLNLLLRLYDPLSGSVNLDELDVSSLNVHSLVDQISIVSQEPALFNRSIRENISYGDHSKNIRMNDVVEVAKLANIHKFITSLPKGYETNVGEMGSQLSGGQKQRIAIARALLKKPKVLLLDEATSALDMKSEKIVQNALDIASSRRTTITIAHRLASIQNADKIYVVNNGVVSESGTHSELLLKQGIYTKLWSIQCEAYSTLT